MKIIRYIWNDIRKGQNLDVYITALLSVIVAILGTFGIANLSVISSAVLATLALLSISVLTNRKENEELQKNIDGLNSSRVTDQLPFTREYDRLELRNRVKIARKMFFWGFSWTTTIPTLGESILEGINNGLDLRFLLVEPSTASAKMAVFGGSLTDESDFDLSLKTSLLRLIRLQQSTSAEKLEVRTADFFPPYRIIAIDPHLPTGYMIIRLTSLRDYRTKAPVIEIKKTDNQEWFDFFVQQFEYIWAKSKPPTEEQYGLQ